MMELAAGQAAAEELVRLLEPVCSRIEIAGSIRRRKDRVKDIELVVIPKLENRYTGGQMSLLYAEEPNMEQVNRLDECIDGWFLARMASPRLDRNGRRALGPAYKRLFVETDGAKVIAVDLFAVLPPAQWGLIYLIRTGSGVGPSGRIHDGFGPAMLARWKQVSDGGYSQKGCLHLPDGHVVFTPEEEDVFRVCHVVWVPPEERESAEAVRAAWEDTDG